jgi:integrase
MPRLSPTPDGRHFLPKYRLHKASGQAVVNLGGKDFYLGPHNSKASRDEYDRRIAEWLAAGRRAPDPSARSLTVVEIALPYLAYAKGYYRKGGKQTGHVRTVQRAIKVLRTGYGCTPANDFGPLKLQAIQGLLIDHGYSRSYINGLVGVIRRLFRWAVTKEMVPESVCRALGEVRDIAKGRTEAKERAPVRPVDAETVESTLPFLPPVIDDMVRFQRLTGCRPGEVCALRPCDIDRSAKVWAYVPASHKTEHHNKQRIIFIGPKAQKVLTPYLSRGPEACCFSPAESDARRKAEMRASRKTKVQPSQIDRSKCRPKLKPGSHYSSESYRRAVVRAVEAANKDRRQGRKKLRLRDLEPWHPNQLRHSAGTEIRKKYGVEAARTVLGHARMETTELYAEQDRQRAAEIMRQIG